MDTFKLKINWQTDHLFQWIKPPDYVYSFPSILLGESVHMKLPQIDLISFECVHWFSPETNSLNLCVYISQRLDWMLFLSNKWKLNSRGEEIVLWISFVCCLCCSFFIIISIECKYTFDWMCTVTVAVELCVSPWMNTRDHWLKWCNNSRLIGAVIFITLWKYIRKLERASFVKGKKFTCFSLWEWKIVMNPP